MLCKCVFTGLNITHLSKLKLARLCALGVVCDNIIATLNCLVVECVIYKELGSYQSKYFHNLHTNYFSPINNLYFYFLFLLFLFYLYLVI